MFTFTSENRIFHQCGLFLLLVQFGLFIIGLPPFHIGLWVQAEPVALAVYICAVLVSIWLLLGIYTSRLVRIAANPLYKALLFLTLWQLIPTLFAQNSWRSWFGPPQTGEGVTWYIAEFLTFLLAFPLWQVVRYRRIILAAAAGSFVISCIPYLFAKTTDGVFPVDSWTPLQSPFFLMFVGLYIAITIIKSDLFKLPTPRPFKLMGLWRRYTIVCCFVPMLWVVLSVATPNASLLKDKNSFLGSHGVLNQVAISTLQHEPLRLLIGGGWGRFPSDLFKYILVDGVEVYHDGLRAPNTTLIDEGTFHSHNEPMEVLLSLGIPGLVLWFSLPIIIILTLPKQQFWWVAPLQIAATTLSFFECQTLECLPYQALAFAALAGTQTEPPSTRHSRMAILLVLVSATAMGWSAGKQIDLLRYDQRLKLLGIANPDKKWIEDDFTRGADRIRNMFPVYLSRFISKAGIKPLTELQVEEYIHFMQLAHTLALTPSVGPEAAFLDLRTDYFTVITFPTLADAQAKALSSTTEAITMMARVAPLRDDLAAFFLQNFDNYNKNSVNIPQEWLSHLLELAPNHRSALWTMGTLLMETESRQREGWDMRNRALSLGLQTVYPIIAASLQAPKKPKPRL